MNNLDKARQEQAMGVGLFDCKYTTQQAELVAEAQGLSWVMVQYWKGIEYHKSESIGSQVET